MANYMMTISIQDQLQAFIQGFYDIIPFKAIKHLTPIELGSLFVGKQDINGKINSLQRVWGALAHLNCYGFFIFLFSAICGLVFEGKHLRNTLHARNLVKELKESTSYSTYTSDSMHIKWLWEIVESWDQELRKKFLFFITGKEPATALNFKPTAPQIKPARPLRDCMCALHFNVLPGLSYLTSEASSSTPIDRLTGKQHFAEETEYLTLQRAKFPPISFI